MASLGKWSANSVTVGNAPETWSTAPAIFGTEDRNDGSAYSCTSTGLLTLPSSGLADGYLIVAAAEFFDDGARYNPQLRITQASGTGNFVGGPTGGYLRDPSEDRAYVRCFAFVDNPSASSTYQVQWKADTDDADAADTTERSELQVIPLYYSNHGIYTSTSASLYGGTTPNVVTGWSVTNESDTAAIEHSANVITVKGDNKRYLILASQFFEGRGGRTQRWHGLDIDGTQENAAKAYSYYRNTSNDESGDLFTWLLETATANVTIEQTCYRGDGVAALQGGADIDGSTPAVGDHTLVVLELNDSAEVFRSQSTTNSSDLGTTTPTDLNVNETTDFNDTASFTDVANTSINCVVTADYLFGANISCASNSIGTGSRWTGYSEYTVNGTEQTDSFAGDYLRNNQSTTDTFGWSANLLGFLGLTAGDDVGVSVTEHTGSEGGGSPTSPAGWTGFWGLNLDTLEDAGGADHTAEPGVGALTLTGQIPTADTTAHVIEQPGASSLALTGQAPTAQTTANLVVNPGVGALAIGPVGSGSPTIIVSENTSISIPSGQVSVTTYVPTVALTANHVRAPPQGGLALSAAVPNIAFDWVVFPNNGGLTLTGHIPTTSVADNKLAAPGAGSLLFTGYAPSLDLSDNQSSSPNAGSLTLTSYISYNYGGPGLRLTGFEPTLVIDFAQPTVEPDTGGLSLLGLAPTLDLSENRVIEPGSGSASLAGLAPTLNLTANIIELPGAGSLQLSGQIPTVDTTANQFSSPAQGGLSLGGYIPVADTGESVIEQPGTGGLSLAGQVPTIDIAGADQTAQPDAGSLTLQGYAPTLPGTSIVVAPESGSLNLTGYLEYSYGGPGLRFIGYEPSIINSTSSPPGTGELTLFGHSPALEIIISNAPASLQITVTGLEPTIDLGTQNLVLPSAYGFNLVGQDVAALLSTIDTEIPVPNKGGILQGRVPSLAYSWTVYPDSQGLTLTGLAPSIERTETVFPGTGSLALTGNQPTVDYVPVLNVPAGRVGLTVHVPSLLRSEIDVDNAELNLTGYPPSIQIPGTGGSGGGPGRKRKPPRPRQQIISFEGITDKIKVEEPPPEIPEEVEVIEQPDFIQEEIDQALRARELLELQIKAAEDEIKILTLQEELEMQIRLEMLKRDILDAIDFLKQIIAQIEYLKWLKKRREEEEIVAAFIVQYYNQNHIIIP